MWNKLLSLTMLTALIVAVLLGLFFRQTYTNVTATSNVIDNFSVALWDVDMSPTLVQTMREDLPNSNFIVRVKSNGQMDYTFKNNKQYVEVLEVFQGDGLQLGDQIAITLLDWMLFFDDMTANLNFVNLMHPGQEYLIFLERKLDTLDSNENNIYLLPGLIIPPIFNYEDKEHSIFQVSEDDRYVPYVKVKDNEFFVSSEKSLDMLLELKHELLQKYPK
ncbi:hypothetical protein ABE096_06400 [Robertmurraya massiliosenegalensis]|uniref:hypothetical protein n=1 Tax=Robertmurraya TaxID=2837507 RepID=UPI0039A7588F